MHGDDKAGLHIEEVCQHTVIQFGSEDLQERHGTQLFADAKLLAVSKLKGAGSDKVFYGKSGGSQPIPGKIEIELLVHVEHSVHQSQTLFAVQGFCSYAEPLKVIKQVCLNAVKPGLCCFHALGFDAEGQILGLDETVVAFGELISQHPRVFCTDVVKVVSLGRDFDVLTVGVLVCRKVHKGQLKFHGAVEVVEKVAPGLKDSGFILVLIELVVDVLELDSLGEVAGFHTADAVLPHSFKRNAVLRRLLLFIRVFCSCDCSLNLLFFCPRELCFCGQYDIPPCRDFPAFPVPHKSCWSYTVFASVAGSRPARCFGQSFQEAVRSFRT